MPPGFFVGCAFGDWLGLGFGVPCGRVLLGVGRVSGLSGVSCCTGRSVGSGVGSTVKLLELLSEVFVLSENTGASTVGLGDGLGSSDGSGEAEGLA